MLSLNQNALDKFHDEHESKKIRKMSVSGNNKVFAEEIAGLKGERDTLSRKISDILKEKNSIKSNLEKALNDKFVLQNQVDDLKDRLSNDTEADNSHKELIKKLEMDVHRERLERSKLEEEMETLQESYSFSLQEIKKIKERANGKKSVSSRTRTRSGKRTASKSPKKGKMSTRR